jgi:sulfatase maturation enzyme AslB (radical SAM superfamily)
MSELVRIWYVASQRLCNFGCDYCVSTGEWAKDSRTDWRHPNDESNFHRIAYWIANQQLEIGVRLAGLGEPFASPSFLNAAARLSTRPNIRFVELVTNGSLLKRRLKNLRETANLERISLWVTHHHTQINVDRFMDNVLAARDHGCFVVVNTLLFPSNVAEVEELKKRTAMEGIRFNVDLGYRPDADSGTYGRSSDVVPMVSRDEWHRQAASLGVDAELLRANLIALDDVHGRPCSAGYRYFFIGIDGDMYGCSRYYELQHGRLGNVLDEGFELPRRQEEWLPCAAPFGCSNKEDFLNLRLVDSRRREDVPSLGWLA